MKYAEKYGVSRASRKYNKSRSYIYFWRARWDGSVESLACQSRRPHSHPNQHTEAELKLLLLNTIVGKRVYSPALRAGEYTALFSYYFFQK